MKIRNVRIHSFRSVRDLELDCKDMIVLLGPNNHGKSNLLNALDFALSTSAKLTKNDFYSLRDDNDDELWVELLFENLSAQEKTTFQKYLDQNGQFRIRKTARLNETDVETGYRGYVGEPEQWWLKASGTGQLLKRDEVVEHAKSITALEELLKEPGRITKQRVEDFQSKSLLSKLGFERRG